MQHRHPLATVVLLQRRVTQEHPARRLELHHQAHLFTVGDLGNMPAGRSDVEDDGELSRNILGVGGWVGMRGEWGCRAYIETVHDTVCHLVSQVVVDPRCGRRSSHVTLVSLGRAIEHGAAGRRRRQGPQQHSNCGRVFTKP